MQKGRSLRKDLKVGCNTAVWMQIRGCVNAANTRRHTHKRKKHCATAGRAVSHLDSAVFKLFSFHFRILIRLFSNTLLFIHTFKPEDGRCKSLRVSGQARVETILAHATHAGSRCDWNLPHKYPASPDCRQGYLAFATSVWTSVDFCGIRISWISSKV